jgi:hypothetical protein
MIIGGEVFCEKSAQENVRLCVCVCVRERDREVTGGWRKHHIEVKVVTVLFLTGRHTMKAYWGVEV